MLIIDKHNSYAILIESQAQHSYGKDFV